MVAEIVAGDHALHARHRHRLADVVGFDARMGMRAAEDGAKQHAGPVEIGGVMRAAFHLLADIDPREPGSDGSLERGHAPASAAVRPAAATASMILR